MNFQRKREQIPEELNCKVRRFCYSVLAFEYKMYFTKHRLPEGVDMNFIVPDSSAFVKGVGEYLNLVNSEQTIALRPLSREISNILKHTEEAFIGYLRWRCHKIKYDHRYKFLCIMSLVSHFVLYYFERNCFRFAITAAEALYEIIRDNDLMLSEFEHPLIFAGFTDFCIRTEDCKGVLDKPGLIKDQFLDFVNNFRNPPAFLLREDRNPIDNPAGMEDIKFLDTPESTADESSSGDSSESGNSSNGSSENKGIPKLFLAAVASAGSVDSLTMQTSETSSPSETENVASTSQGANVASTSHASTSKAANVASASHASTSQAANVASTSEPGASSSASPSTSKASISATKPDDPFKSESKMEIDAEENKECSLCDMDCSIYLKGFVSEFKRKYT